MRQTRSMTDKDKFVLLRSAAQSVFWSDHPLMAIGDLKQLLDMFTIQDREDKEEDAHNLRRSEDQR